MRSASPSDLAVAPRAAAQIVGDRDADERCGLANRIEQQPGDLLPPRAVVGVHRRADQDQALVHRMHAIERRELAREHDM